MSSDSLQRAPGQSPKARKDERADKHGVSLAVRVTATSVNHLTNSRKGYNASYRWGEAHYMRTPYVTTGYLVELSSGDPVRMAP